MVDLCVRTAIDNLRYLGDVGETDLYLLDRILPHCTVDQLMRVEKCTEVRNSLYLLCLQEFYGSAYAFIGVLEEMFENNLCREEI